METRQCQHCSIRARSISASRAAKPGCRCSCAICRRPIARRRKGVVLYVHGATFPSALSIAHRFDGRSWRDELCAAGFHVWGFDFHGYGHSDPYPDMSEPPEGREPLCTAEDASRQLEQAARFICQHHATERVSIIAHSWGTIVAGRFAARCPELVDRLVLFGAIARRNGSAAQGYPAWRLVSLQDQWQRFTAEVPSRRTARAVAPTFRRMGRALSGQRPGQPDADAAQRADAEWALVRHRLCLGR